MGFLAGEYVFEQMSSVKTRKHYVLADLGFSGKASLYTLFKFIFNKYFVGFWAFLYFVGFWYLTNQWRNAKDPDGGFGVNNVQAAIAFSFFSIFSWVSFFKLLHILDTI